MPGFNRRVTYVPGTEYITKIEGVVTIDAPPPGAVQAAGTGVACVVGEFSDMTNAVSVDTSGNVTTNAVPVELFSSADMIAKVGGFDETIGDSGISGGNGFIALRNKKFSRIIAVPVNLCSAKGARFWRDLPLNVSATNATAVVPVLGGTINAGTEFRNGSGRLRIGKRVSFTSRAPIATGVGGSLASASTAVTQTFTATGGFDWTTITRPDGSLGARKGDILVIGYNTAGAKTPTAEAGTYRVASDPSAGANITIERMDGVTFAITTQSTISWRLHYATDADSGPERVPGAALPGGYSSTQAGGYVVPVRPLTNTSGANTDGNWSADTLLTPATVPAATTGNTWDVLSGLAGKTITGSNTAFTAAVQGINAASAASIDALYSTAIDSLLGDALPAREVNILWSARTSSTIRAKLKSHVLSASGVGVGRVAVLSPEINTVSVATAIGDSDPGVGANRDERVMYAWPGWQTSVPEAVNYRLGTADGSTTIDGILDVRGDGVVASLMSILPPERNIGQSASPVPEIMAPFLALQRGLPSMGISEYIQFRDKGVIAARVERTAGPVVQSGITTSLLTGQKNINRRRMADFIEDSLSTALKQFCKLPLTNQLRDAAVGEVDGFLNSLLSPNNPSSQRIAGYLIDDKSGNTPDLLAQGIYVIIVKVQTLSTADFIVLNAQVGESVNVTTA